MGHTYTDWYFVSVRMPVMFFGVWSTEGVWRLWDLGFEDHKPIVTLCLN